MQWLKHGKPIDVPILVMAYEDQLHVRVEAITTQRQQDSGIWDRLGQPRRDGATELRSASLSQCHDSGIHRSQPRRRTVYARAPCVDVGDALQ